MLMWREEHGVWLPPVDVYETGNSWIVHMELPGVDFQDLELTVTHDTLQVSGEKKIPSGNLSTLRLEIYTGSFKREIQFPDCIDVPNVTAVMDSGILTVTLPRSESAKIRIPVDPSER